MRNFAQEKTNSIEPKLKMKNEVLMDKLREGFDPEYYLTKNTDVLVAGIDPLEHFMTSGWRENRRPNSWFDSADYIARNASILDAETNPFLHFMMHKGELEGSASDKLSDAQVNRALYWANIYREEEDAASSPVIISLQPTNQQQLDIVRPTFDPDYYMEQYPELVGKISDPLIHYMTIGWVELRNPNPEFSTSYYLRNNNDIRLQGINPYLHYLLTGHKEKSRSSASVEDAKILEFFEADPEMMATVAKAKSLDPMVAIPTTNRIITSPLKASTIATDVLKNIRRKMIGKTFKYVVAVPLSLIHI